MADTNSQEISVTLNYMSTDAICFYQGYQKILAFLSNEQEMTASEDLVIQKTELPKEVVLYIIEQLINHGFIIQSLHSRQHWYRLRFKNWEIRLTISPTCS